MDIWEKTLAYIKDKVSPQNFTTWFSPIKPVRIEEGSVELEVPNRFFKDWINENYLGLIKEGFHAAGLGEYVIKLKVSTKTDRHTLGVNKTPLSIKRTGTSEKNFKGSSLNGSNLNAKYTFENFVVGKSNEFAHAACHAVADNPSNMYNPLFIYGGVGLGKTHLLQAIGNSIISRRDNLRVCYYTAEMFMNELINSIRFEKMADFRKKFREMDILLIDDIQFIAGKERTQEEFFHTFNALHGAHSQIVLTSDKFPKDIEGLEERLKTRLGWGLIADIQPPEMETRVAILKKKAGLEGIDLPDDVAFYIASLADSNIRELEGYLIRVIAYSSLTGCKISLEMSKDVLKDVTNVKERFITIEDIQKATCRYFNIKMSELKSKTRAKNIAFPRQISMYLCKEYTKASFPEIGREFGGKDHSTVIHSYKKIESALKVDTQLQKTLNAIKELIGK